MVLALIRWCSGRFNVVSSGSHKNCGVGSAMAMASWFWWRCGDLVRPRVFMTNKLDNL